ncbi:MAG: hypothetical protein L3J45_09355 [Flavobacteriaceae bacterium]|nr:hypothetical protein [Flavobacteriaceae bacterium]
MTKQLTFLLFIGFVFQVQAQITRLSIVGKVSNDYVSVESIHILNKSTKKGTISNTYGMFKIPVKANDTLLFDGIQFKKKEIIITSEILKSKTLEVALKLNINELDAVEIKNHNLSGDLLIDAKNVKKPVSLVSKEALNFGKINFNMVDDIDAIDRQKPPDPFTGTSAQVQGGVNILVLIGFVLSPIVNEIGKIGRLKRKRKQAKKAYAKKALTIPDKIRDELGEAFFTNTLKISKDQIDAFITYCQPKGIVDLYMANKKIEMIQLLVDESKIFKASVKN